VYIFLVLIPLISAFNYFLTYSKIEWGTFLLLTYTIDTIQGFLAWWVFREIVFWMDWKLPYGSGWLRRIILQIVATTTAGLLVISLTTELASLIAKGEFAPLHFYTHDLLIISIWFLVLNSIYIILFLLRHRQVPVKETAPSWMLVREGKAEIRLPLSDIIYAYTQDGLSFVVAQDTRRYLMAGSLSQLEEQLPNRIFFRFNRSILIRKDNIQGFERLEHGKLMVSLIAHPRLPQKVPVSRAKAPAFKEWFRTI
jgi:DNA-binding LytR/AlgR family response regulator